MPTPQFLGQGTPRPSAAWRARCSRTECEVTFNTGERCCAAPTLAEDANLGTCLANTNTIDANGKWKFEAFCIDDSDEIADVKFKELTGF